MTGGILITEGMTFSLAQLSFTINKETGKISTGCQPMLHYDVCPAWLSIGIDHLKDAKQARDNMLAAKDTGNYEQRNQALDCDFRGSMQAIMSSAIAIDALYAVVKSKLKPDAEPFDPEKKKRAPRRFAQVSEQLRQAFQLKHAGFAVLRDAIEQIFKFRDEAVHPTGNSTQPVLHPDLNVGVERRLVVFRYENALAIVQTAVCIISELVAKGKAKNAALEQYAKSLKVRLDPIRAESLLGLPPFEN